MIPTTFLVVLLGVSATQGLRIPASRRTTGNTRLGNSFSVTRPGTSSRVSTTANAATTGSGSDDNDISSVRDIVYMASVTVAGKEYAVQIDTGSSDMWIRSDSMANTQISNVNGNITYGIGWAAGPISRANVSFAGFNVSSQAFMMATSANNPILSWGAEGLLGLGGNTLSTIDKLVNGTGNSWGRTVLYNIFAQSPTTPNYIAFLLQRSESESTVSSEGSFTIGELEPEYEAAINATDAIPTWPLTNPTRWTVLVDSYDTTGAVSHSLSSSVSGVPSGKAVALLDSGTSYAYGSVEFCENLYSSIPGATFSSTLGQWVMPCTQEVNLGITIGGRRFPVHPLDIISPSLTSTDNTTCYGTFIPQSFSVGAGEFDLLLGDMFLRNVYSLYDFGDFQDAQGTVMGNPYVKLLSITNATTASAEFHQLRGGSASEANKVSNAQSSSVGPTSSSSTVSTTSDTLDRLVRYAEIMMSLLAISTFLLVIAVGTMAYFLFFKRNKRTRNAPAGAAPDATGGSGFGLGHLRPPGPAYQQVPSARSSVVP